MNGPNIIPHGPIKNPNNNPTVAPQTTFLLPPLFFVPHIGSTLSRIDIITVIMPSITMPIQDISS